MSLQLFLGNSGSGKSHLLYETIISQAVKYPQKQFILIVPEQFTLQTQRDIVFMHPRKGIMNIDVLSFERLAFRIFEETGQGDIAILEETGKSLVLRKIAANIEKDLQILGFHLKKSGYVSEIKSMLSELVQYNVSLESLDKMIALSEHQPALQMKLKDLKLLYQEFFAYLADHYITTEEIPDRLCQVADQSVRMKDSIIAFDGFTGFTPIQNKVLERLMPLTEKIYITVTLDSREDPFRKEADYKLWHMSKKTISQVTAMAVRQRIEIEEPVVLKKTVGYRFGESKDLKWLEQHLYRYGKETYQEAPEHIHIWETPNPLQEAKAVGQEICRLVFGQGYRYQDIGVIAGDMEVYSHVIKRVFLNYQIPVFIDEKRSILLNPFVEFLRSLLQVIKKNFSYDSVFRYLRTNLAGIEREETDQLENDCLAFGIRGFSKWNREWEELEESEPIRQRVVAPFQPVISCIKSEKSTLREKTEALYQLITGLEIEQQLKAYEERFITSGEQILAAEYHQIYPIVMGILDKMVSFLGEETMSLEEYIDILEAGLSEAKIGMVPPGADSVMVGDLERTRLEHIKVLFFVGMNEGMVPKISEGGGILSDVERDFLQENNVELAPTAREKTYIQKFYLYLCLTKPSDLLYLSFSKSSAGGDALRPSQVIGIMENLYPDLKVISKQQGVDLEETPVCASAGMEQLIAGLQELKEGRGTLKFLEIYNWYAKQDIWKPKLNQLIQAAYLENPKEALEKAVVQALYGTELVNSVSRLEKFSACAFSHFLQYGLRLRERREYEFLPVDLGNVFHMALEQFSKELEAGPYNWLTITDEQAAHLSEQALLQVTEEYGNTILHSTARNEYMIDRIRRILKRTIWGIRHQIKAGRFLPKHYEIPFHFLDQTEVIQIRISDQEKMRLTGKIDRIDIYEEEDTVYVRVVDYKTGNKTFDLNELYYGTQLQLAVYLNAALELEKRSFPHKNIVPAGLFYYCISDPMLDKKEGISKEEIEAGILEQLKLEGLANESDQMLIYQDSNLAERAQVLKISLKKDGSLNAASEKKVATTRQFKVISKYANEKIREIGLEIVKGTISVNPYELEEQDACSYCIYKGICQMDGKIPGFEKRKLKKMSEQDLYERMEGDE